MPKSGHFPRHPDKDWLLELGNLLQTSLELEKLIELFSEHARSVVDHESVGFECAEQGIYLSSGTAQRYSCTYDIVLLENYLGTLTLTRSTRFSEEEMGKIEYMLVGLVYPIRNAYLYRNALRVASHDPLTGVHNRTNLNDALDREIELARRYATPLSLIMLDVDRFKIINDTHGHVVGDYALKTLAECIVTCTRDSDIVFRYGGEEFLVVLSNTDLGGATFLAERIREAVQGAHIQFDDIDMCVTASLGVAALAPNDDRMKLIEKTDKALYESKSSGRNCVTATATTG